MRKWAIGGIVFIGLLSIPMYVEYLLAHPTVPPGIQLSGCLIPSAPSAESSNDRFSHLGGRENHHSNAQWNGGFYTIPDIAQGRNLTIYDELEIRDHEHFHPWERWENPVLAQARRFLWEHWRDRRRAYLILTMSSIDWTRTSHIFVEPDDSGHWRVFIRYLDRRDLVDAPTAYSVTWVKPNGWDAPGSPLSEGQTPDALADELELRDACGERTGQF